jgi:hypothetical protein
MSVPQPFKKRAPRLDDPIRVELWAICLMTGLSAFVAGSLVGTHLGQWYLAVADIVQNVAAR